MLRIIYMGTPAFAVPALEALSEHAEPGALLSEGYEIATVITRLDKPVGRGHELSAPPVKQASQARGLPVWQPGSLKRAETIEALAAYQADLYIVAAFGQILPQAVLDQPRYGTLNIHASLLPRYRGVSPISEAILQDEQEAGVTIMLLDAGIDTGPMLHKRKIALAPTETTGSLTTRLANEGAQALLEVLPRWIAGEITPEAQDASLASYTQMLRKEHGHLVWSEPAALLERRVRAYTPWPGAYGFWRGKLLKIISAQTLTQEAPASTVVGSIGVRREAGQPQILIATGDGQLLVERLQLEGRKALSAAEFLRGNPQLVGEILT